MSLAGCSPKGHKESDMTERQNTQHNVCVYLEFIVCFTLLEDSRAQCPAFSIF